MRPSRKSILTFTTGIALGGLGAHLLEYRGVNFRLLPHTLQGHTIVRPNRGVHDNRVERIFAQFAHQLRPSFSSAEAHKVLNATWLTKEMITGIYVIAGQVPVQFADDDTIFYLNLASPSDDLTGGIYFTLSGGSTLTAEDAQKFLTGKGPEGMRLKEFALCHARGNERSWRVERFTRWGINVYQN